MIRRRPQSRDVRAAGIYTRALGISMICAAVAFGGACSKREESVPADAKTRSTWMQAAAGKLNAQDQRTIARFVARLDAQDAAGSAASAGAITVTRALELQTAYENSVAQAQSKLAEQLDLAKSAVAIDIVDPVVVKAEPPHAASDKALRFTVKVNNRGKRTVDRVAMRIEIRDASGTYQAAIANLDLGGPLRAGETGRSSQALPLDASRHQYILDGKPLQIVAYPLEIAYADGAKLVPGQELKALELLHNAKVE